MLAQSLKRSNEGLGDLEQQMNRKTGSMFHVLPGDSSVILLGYDLSSS